MKIKLSAGEIVFNIINYTLITLLCITTLYPFWNSLMISLDAQNSVMGGEIHLIPKNVSFTAWEAIVKSSFIWHTGYNTIVKTVVGTLVAMLLSVMAAYPLAKKSFPHRKFFTGLIVFTMIFNGGIIPLYILVKNLGLMDNFWSLILPYAINPFNVIILRNFFQYIPESIEESAKIDGANDIYILARIVLPLSLPVMATVTLWIMVQHWNSWFDAVLFLNTRSKFVLQLVLREIIVQNVKDPSMLNPDVGNIPSTTESIQAACTMFVTIPILLVYPFIQKYFAKGIMVGAVKG